jgi:hypothetical protein
MKIVNKPDTNDRHIYRKRLAFERLRTEKHAARADRRTAMCAAR